MTIAERATVWSLGPFSVSTVIITFSITADSTTSVSFLWIERSSFFELNCLELVRQKKKIDEERMPTTTRMVVTTGAIIF